MLTTDLPAGEELVKRAADLVPVLRKHAVWSEEHRRVHDETIEALADAGIFRLRVPSRYGGYESDAATLLRVASELGRGDGSTAWTASVYWIPTWMVGLFPDAVQDEVFSTPNVRVCGTLSPSAMATPVAGGVLVSGKWGFVSGALHSHWQQIVAVQVSPDVEPMPIIALVPMSSLQIVDDWYTGGLRGSGSVSTVADQVFVPQERILPLPAILQGQSASAANAGSAMYRAPLLPVASASSAGTIVGLARAATEVFFERMPERKITYTAYEHQTDAPVTHLQVADAAQALERAEFHATRLTGEVDAKCANGSQWTLLERVRARADLGATCQQARHAVDVLAAASGGSSVYDEVPMLRIARDAGAICLHALMNPATNAELYGRVLCGLEPNTLYV